MKLTEYKLEQLFAATLTGVDLPIYCFWDETLRTGDTQVQRSAISIKASPKGVAEYSSDVVEINLSVTLVMGAEDINKGIGFMATWKLIDDTIARHASCSGCIGQFNIENEFTCNAVSLTGVGDCGYDTQSKVWWATAALTFHGVVLRDNGCDDGVTPGGSE